MSIGFMYILECSDGSFYTGSTKNLERRLAEHQGIQGDLDIERSSSSSDLSERIEMTGRDVSRQPSSPDDRGANYTKKRRPVKLVYYEEYSRIDEAFYREKQVQGWSRKKKLALIEGKAELLPQLAKKIFRKKAAR